MSETVFLPIIALVIAILLHEIAHGLVALWMGDHTAKVAGRLTLNPLKHIDRFGSIILPLILLVGQLVTIKRVVFLYGWAKPVPVNPMNLRLGNYKNPRRLMAIVALAGPMTNFILALLGGVLIHLATIGPWPSALNFLVYFIEINLILGIFNLIPMPPLDGGRIIVGILPLRLAVWVSQMEKIGLLVILLVLFILPLAFRQIGIVFDPFNEAFGVVMPWAVHVVLVLTGNHV